jgi:hypothetical protein
MSAYPYIQKLLAALEKKQIPDDGVLYAEKLFLLDWHYDWESVNQVDDLLSFLKQENITIELLVSQIAGKNLLVLLAAYMMEVLRRYMGLSHPLTHNYLTLLNI